MTYVIGVDGGTESLRAGVFDLQGSLVASSASPYTTQYPHPGWAEQRPEDWWRALGEAVSGAVRNAGIQSNQVSAICVDTTCCTVVALDREGGALRPALLWMDMRSAEQAEQVLRCGDHALKVNGGGAGLVSAEWMVPKSLWIKQNEPEIWAQATTICEYQDYINLRLTGRRCASVNNASVRWHYSAKRGWPTSMLEKLGIAELASDKWPQDLLSLGEVIGGLTEEAARHLGLPLGTPVAQGGADAFIGMIGLGVVRPGQMALLTGSSHLQLGLAAQEIHGPGIFGTYEDALLPGLHIIEGGQTSTGSIVNWFKRNLVPEGTGYDLLNEEASVIPPGCEGLTCLDHFQGNRTPHTDPISRGALVGLTLKHTRGHIFRSLMESVACGTRLILDTMTRSGGYRPESIAIAGGATRSPLWLQMHADVCNVPFVLTKETEAPMLGCAVLAAVAAGLYPDIPSAVSKMVSVERVVQPDVEAHQAYAAAYARYLSLYPALKPTFHSASSHTSNGTAPLSSRTPEAFTPPLQAYDISRLSGGPKISASILAADFARLGEEVGLVLEAGSEWIHVDMFDGSYVDNFTIGPPVLKALRRMHPKAFFDCHLATRNPSRYIQEVAASGASQMTFHVEVCESHEAIASVAAAIKTAGMRCGLALAPETPAEFDLLGPLVASGVVDLILCMTVEPGFGGQKMKPEVLAKVTKLRAAFPTLDIQVDGGVTSETAPLALKAGANILVAGSAIFSVAAAAAAAQQMVGVAGREMASGVTYAEALAAAIEAVRGWHQRCSDGLALGTD